MDNRKYFKLMTNIAEEASLNLPLEDIQSTDKTELVKFSKFQLFKAKSKLFKEIGTAKIEAAKNKVQVELKSIATLPIEALQNKLASLMPQTQFRNLEKLDKDEILKLIEDSLILDNLDEDDE
ncbi:MAG: hypothetical protein N4A71_14910 [Carboxylicivirga sp.]|jgi:hypothetical protein|nr:hypothetical protein [Carboxylicivirga sp.]